MKTKLTVIGNQLKSQFVAEQHISTNKSSAKYSFEFWVKLAEHGHISTNNSSAKYSFKFYETFELFQTNPKLSGHINMDNKIEFLVF